MARFDVYRRRVDGGYLLDCQADLLSDLTTRFVVPLLPPHAAPKPAARLNPILSVGGEPYVMVTQFAAAVMKSELGQSVDNRRDDAEQIVGALDLLITGV
jgi:toxin CcdB